MRPVMPVQNDSERSTPTIKQTMSGYKSRQSFIEAKAPLATVATRKLLTVPFEVGGSCNTGMLTHERVVNTCPSIALRLKVGYPRWIESRYALMISGWADQSIEFRVILRTAAALEGVTSANHGTVTRYPQDVVIYWI